VGNGKVCKKCNTWKVYDEFTKHKNCTRDGHKGTCKDCEKAYKKRYYEDNKEKIAVKNKEKYERNKNNPEFIAKRKAYQEKTKNEKREYDKNYREANKERIKERQKRYWEEHKEERSAYSKKWREENEEYLKEYRENNKDRRRKLNKKYWAENKEEQKARIAKWRKENAEYIKQYRIENRERDREQQRKWYNTDRGRKLSMTKTNAYRAKKKQLQNDLTAEQWNDCLKYFNNTCAYCGEWHEVLEQEHFVPVSKDGAFTKSNIIPSCRSCNASKLNRDFFEWYPKQNYYSIERENKILSYLGREVKNDSFQIQ